MPEQCRVSVEELKFDQVNPVKALEQRIERQNKRHEVMEMAQKLLDGKPVKITRYERDYTIADLFNDVAEHDLFDAAALRTYFNDPIPMRDLIIRCAQFAVCAHLYDESPEDLGFIS